MLLHHGPMLPESTAVFRLSKGSRRCGGPTLKHPISGVHLWQRHHLWSHTCWAPSRMFGLQTSGIHREVLSSLIRIWAVIMVHTSRLKPGEPLDPASLSFR